MVYDRRIVFRKLNIFARYHENSEQLMTCITNQTRFSMLSKMGYETVRIP